MTLRDWKTKLTFLVILFTQILPIQAVDFTFNVPLGDWQDGNNWNPIGPPANTTVDTATINGSRTALVQSSNAPLDQARTVTVGDVNGNGIVRVTANGTLTTGNAIIGAAANSVGEVGVDSLGGPGTWNNTAAGNTGLLNIGLNGRGILEIGNGGQVITTDAIISTNFGAFDSNVRITGTGSTFTITNNFTVGDSDRATLEILAGAQVSNIDSTIALTVNSTLTSTTVDGTNSLWDNTGLLIVGDEGQGTLNVQNGGQVNADDVQVGLTSSISGFGTLNLLATGNPGLLRTNSISGGTGASFLVFDGGILQAASNNLSFISGMTLATFQSAGAIFDTQSFSVTTAQTFAGNGALTKLGTGTLILTGINNLPGNATIAAGTLQGNTVSLPRGNILNQDALIFDQSANGTFAGQISGTGSVRKENTGNLTLTGTNSYSGGTVIATGGGILTVNTNSLPTGNVTNNASLVFDQSFLGTFAGNISGTGTLTKQNSGTLILTGVNSYLGATTISAGTLQGNTTSIPSNGGVINNGSLVFDQSFLGLYGGNISGTGSLTKQNNGLLILLGSNNYSNGTIITGGSLQVNTDSLPAAGGVINNASLIFNQISNAFYTGNITGTGTLTKQNIGTLVLTGINSYAGGTTINGGALQGNTISIPSGPVLNNASLVFDQAFDAGFSGPIVGTGSLTKNNIGTLILAAANTYSGGTAVNGGTLLGNSLSLQGTIANNANVVFDQSFDGTYSGTMFGSGNLVKQGSGKLQMTGNSSAFFGNTSVNAGNLNVNGVLGGITTINMGAILSGNGVLNTVINKGTIAPGNSIGTLHVINFVNDPTGIYQAEINSSRASSLIAASGTAILNGGALVVTADPGIYLKGTTYTIISANGGLFGTFASTFLPANVPLSLSYLPNSLILTVLDNTLNIAGLFGNPLRVAEYLRDHVDPTPDFITIVDALNTLDAQELEKALDQLHPAIFQALALTVGDTSHLIQTTFTDRLAYLRRSLCMDCDPCHSKIGLWTAGVADFIRQSRTEELRRFTSSNEGLAFGFDHCFNPSLLAGVGAGYTHSNLHWGNSAGHTQIDGYYLGAYATRFTDDYYLDGAVLGFVNQHHVKRHIQFATIDRNAKNRHCSYGFNPHLGAGLFLNYCSIDIIPFFDIDYYLVQQNKAREHGAESLNLRVKRNQTNLLRLETGLNFSKCFALSCGNLLPQASISYVAHRVLSGKKYISSFENVEGDFSVFGTKYCFNQLELGAGLTYFIDESLALNAWYDIELGHKRQEQEVNLEINYSF